MSPAENRENVVFQSLRSAMKQAGMDALVASSPDNVTYTAGFLVPTHATNRFRRTFSILAAGSFAAQIVVTVEHPLAIARSRFSDVRAYHQFRDSPADVLADALIEAGVADGRIGIELDHLPAEDFVKLKERLPNAEWIGCKDLYFGVRLVKTAEEVSILRTVGQLTERVLADASREIKPGLSELQVANQIVGRMIEGGSTDFKYRVGSGANSSIVNCGTTDKRIEQGDVIRIEVLGSLGNYRSNVTRTFSVGKPTGGQRDAYASLIRAQKACEKLIRKGTHVADLYRTYVESCRSSGIEPTLTFLGHGIGLTVHEEPYLTDTRNVTLQPNVCFTMEPLYMVPGEFGLHVENMFVTTADGFERITGDILQNDEIICVG